jgi:hypothetical protein
LYSSHVGFHDPYSSPNITVIITSRKIRWAVHLVHIGKGRGCVMGKPERKFSRPRRRLEDIVQTDLQEIQWGLGMD